MATDKHNIAIHETGHAIAARVLGLQFDMISIVRGEGNAGSIGVEGDDRFSCEGDMYSPENEAKFQDWAETQATIDYAGHAALVVVLGIGDMSHKSARMHGAAGRNAVADYSKASRRLGGNRTRMVKAKARAVAIVTEHAKDIRKVAGWLLKLKRLDSQQVDMVMHYGTPEGPF